MMVYLCTKFHEAILEVIKVIDQTQISKGHNSVKKGGVTVLVLCTSSDCGLYLYKVS